MSDLDMYCLNDAMTAHFTSRESLEKEDLDVIRRLKLSFRGHTNWPQFRSYRPNHAPWHLDAWEVRLMTRILEQACHVAERFAADRDMLKPPREGAVLTRVPTGEGNDLGWADEWMDPPPPVDPPLVTIVPDKGRLEAVKNRCPSYGNVWEMDLFPLYMPIMDRDRPYCAFMLMIVDRESGYVCMAEGLSPWTWHEEICEKVFGVFEKMGGLPGCICITSGELGIAFREASEELGVALEYVNELPALAAARDSMRDFLGR